MQKLRVKNVKIPLCCYWLSKCLLMKVVKQKKKKDWFVRGHVKRLQTPSFTPSFVFFPASFLPSFTLTPNVFKDPGTMNKLLRFLGPIRFVRTRLTGFDVRNVMTCSFIRCFICPVVQCTVFLSVGLGTLSYISSLYLSTYVSIG